MVHTRSVVAAVLLMGLALAPLSWSQSADCLDNLNPLARLRIKTNEQSAESSQAGQGQPGDSEGGSLDGEQPDRDADPGGTSPTAPPSGSGGEPPTIDLTNTQGLMWLLQLLAYAVAGALIVFLLYLLFKYLGNRTGSIPTGTSTAREKDNELESAPVPTLMTSADSLATGGDYRLALRYLLTAALRHLEKRGLLDYKPTATDWEHLRALRATGHQRVYDRLLPATRLVERKWYGVSEASLHDYTTVQRIVGPILEATGGL